MVNYNFIVGVLITANCISGLGLAILCINIGEYISLCACEETKGFYFGYFWSWFMSAQIIGNFVGAELAESTLGPQFFIILSALIIVFCMGFCFLKMPVKIRSEGELAESDVTTLDEKKTFV